MSRALPPSAAMQVYQFGGSVGASRGRIAEGRDPGPSGKAVGFRSGSGGATPPASRASAVQGRGRAAHRRVVNFMWVIRSPQQARSVPHASIPSGGQALHKIWYLFRCMCAKRLVDVRAKLQLVSVATAAWLLKDRTNGWTRIIASDEHHIRAYGHWPSEMCRRADRTSHRHGAAPPRRCRSTALE